MFYSGRICDVIIWNLEKYTDERGWLVELFRADGPSKNHTTMMAYISATNPGVVRGPHEHASQSDMMCFLGPSNFALHLWDNRTESPTYMAKEIIKVGSRNPTAIIIPPGVVHAYKNIGDKIGMVVNLPNRLYKGRDKKHEVDGIRHEDNPNTVFKVE